VTSNSARIFLRRSWDLTQKRLLYLFALQKFRSTLETYVSHIYCLSIYYRYLLHFPRIVLSSLLRPSYQFYSGEQRATRTRGLYIMSYIYMGVTFWRGILTFAGIVIAFQLTSVIASFSNPESIGISHIKSQKNIKSIRDFQEFLKPYTHSTPTDFYLAIHIHSPTLGPAERRLRPKVRTSERPTPRDMSKNIKSNRDFP
jgi:hypothetical protein